ncbi:MAG: phosphatidylserine decarboxylase [Arenicellales bacterium]
MKTYPIIAREGWERLAVGLIVSLFATFTIGGWSVFFWVGFIFMLQFFRDPPRNITAAANEIVAPASGKVIKIEQVEDPYLNRPCTKISIFMNVFSVHSNLIPISGTIKQRWYSPGKFLNAAVDKASSENERNALWVETEDGQDVVFVQVAGLIARRILCYVVEGDEMDTGDRYGFIRFGSRVDLYLPQDVTVKTRLGDSVHSGNDIIATLSAH